MRFVALDSWRGIAALMVAAYHFEATWHFHGLPMLANSYLFVDFFFVLSGFVIAHAYGAKVNSRTDLAAFAVRRFGRLWPLAASVLAAFVTVEIVKLALVKVFGISTGAVPFDPEGYTPLRTLTSHLLLTTSLGIDQKLTWNGPDWSISAEFWTYLVFGSITLFGGRWRLAGFAAVSLIAAALLVTQSSHGMDATYELGFVRCVYGFMLGQLVYALRLRLPSPRPNEAWLRQNGEKVPGQCGASLRDDGRMRGTFLNFETKPPLSPRGEGAMHTLLECAAVGLVIVFLSTVTHGPVSYLAPFVFAIAVFIFSYEQGAVSRILTARPLRALGDRSYSIYMVHAFVWFVLGMTISVWQRRNGLDLWQIVSTDGGSTRMIVSPHIFALDLLFAAYLTIVLALASVTKRWIEDPGRRYFGKIASRISNTPETALKRSRQNPHPEGL